MTDWIWFHPDCEYNHNIKDYVGFVYYIENKLNGKYYIGQKKFWFKRKLKPLKGQKRFRHVLKESNWKTYYGSCMELQEDLKKYGEAAFTRKIIHLCKSKAQMNYLETKEQFKADVLLDPKSYNKIVNCRINANQLKNVEW